jgi:HEAT repeat protein
LIPPPKTPTNDPCYQSIKEGFIIKNRPRIVAATISAILLLSLAGCSRTVDDVARWTTAGNTKKLIGALEDPKPAVRKNAAKGLGELKAEPAVDPLATLFNDPDSEVLLNSVGALMAIGNESAAMHLANALRLENPQARMLAIEAVGQLKARHAIDALVAALDDNDGRFRCAAAMSLGLIGDEKASAPLVKKLASAAEPLRLACAQALGKTGGETAIQGLILALADESADIRSAATTSLVAIGKPATPSILEALKHAEETVRDGALSVLGQTESIPTGGADSVWYTGFSPRQWYSRHGRGHPACGHRQRWNPAGGRRP